MSARAHRAHWTVRVGGPMVCACAAVLLAACSASGDDEAPSSTTIGIATSQATTTTSAPADIDMTAADFKPLSEMTAVRGFFIDNVLGDLDATLAVAESPTGGTYPVGTVIQLVPQEAMVKRAPGFSPGSNDWEFFELTVSAEGTEIRNRGGAEIVNFLGLSCANCHAKAEPQWDFVCEQDHGCDPLPMERAFFEGLQQADPRPPSS
jgi:hypothetical protein